MASFRPECPRTLRPNFTKTAQNTFHNGRVIEGERVFRLENGCSDDRKPSIRRARWKVPGTTVLSIFTLHKHQPTNEIAEK